MTFSSKVGALPSEQFLFDCGAYNRWPNWRNMAWWPASVEEIKRLQSAWIRTIVDFMISQSDPDIADSLTLGYAGLATRTLPMAEAAVALQRANELGATMIGGPDEANWLNGSSSADTPPIGTTPHLPTMTTSKHPHAKRLVLSARWNSPWRWPQAFLRPDATIMVTNQFLSDEARRSGKVLCYRDAGATLMQTRVRAGPPRPSFDVTALAHRFVEALLPHCPVSGELRDRLGAMMRAKVEAVLTICAADIATVRHAKQIPKEIWGGTGNAYALRVIALEALRRGARIRLHDHGGTTAMVRAVDSFAARELAVCTEYVVPSRGLARLNEMRESEQRIRPMRTSAVVGGDGEKHLLKLPLLKRGPVFTRPRVVYVSAVLRGFHRTGLIPLPDPVYLEWQLRVAETLKAMPLELLCKPHPEGVFRGRPHPLEQVAQTTYVRFEETIADADVFVFDRCASTTFWEATCTDRPIVYLDMKILEIAKQVRPLLERRCRIVPVTFDDFSRPHFEIDSLREAVLGAPAKADPSEFQELFIGDAH